MIKTKNLTIRPISDSDDKPLFRIYGDKTHNAYNPSPPFPSIEHSQSVLRAWAEHWNVHGFGNHAISLIADESSVIGFGGFSVKTFKGNEVISLGYKLSPEVWGNGFATEFVAAIIAHSQLTEHAAQVIARTHPENLASIRVLQKTGFSYLGHYDDHDGMGLIALFCREI